MQQSKIIGAGLFFVFALGCGSENAIEDSGLSAYTSCPTGNICFYNGSNGTGGRCTWREFDQDWTSGSSSCSWSRTMNVKSVSNKTQYRMEYFKQPNYRDRVGSTQPGVSGNLAGTYKLGSHRIQCSIGLCLSPESEPSSGDPVDSDSGIVATEGK